MRPFTYIPKLPGLILGGALLAQAGAAATPPAWSQFRGPGGQGLCPDAALPVTWSADKNVRWKTPLPGPGGSSPVVFGDRIFLTSFSGYAVAGSPAGDLSALLRHVIAVDRVQGRIFWSKDLPAKQPEEAKVRDHGYASSTPLVDAERLYVFCGKSGVFAFDHEGRQLWQADVGSETHGWGSAASPVPYENTVIINAAVESGALVALEKTTGREIWRAGGIKESWNTPILVPVAGGKRELVMAMFGKVLGFDPDTGQNLWSCDTGIGWYMVPSLANEGDMVYCIGGRTGGALAVRAGGRGDVTASRRLWTLSKGSNVSSPLLYQGHLYWFHENLGIAYGIDAASGKVVFEERLNRAGQIYGSPVLASGRIYGFTRNGTGFVLAARPQFEQLARNELGDRSSFDASPAVDGNRLLVRSDKFLYCLGAD